MENVERSVLVEDLRKKLDRFGDLREHPAYFVSECFYELRNSVDYDAEKLLQKLQESAEDGESAIKNLRADYIRRLKELESEILKQLPEVGDDSYRVYASLSRSIENFSSFQGDVNDLEDAYIRLALKIIDATNQLERQLFSGQSIFYIAPNNDEKLGTLVHLKDDFLTREETSCLRSAYSRIQDLKKAFEEMEMTLNSSLAVNACRPFVVTKSSFVLVWLANLLESSSANQFVYFESHRSSEIELSEQNGNELERFIAHEYAKLAVGLKNQTINGLDVEQNPFTHFPSKWIRLYLNDNRLRRLESQQLPPPEHLYELDLRNNALEALDTDFLAKCVNLRSLRLLDSCSPEVGFDVGFLSSLSMLKFLSITLPAEMRIDYAVFQALTELSSLRIESDSKKDNKRPKLPSEAFLQLAALSRLNALAFSYFEIEAVDRKILAGFRSLETLNLSNNRIVAVADDAFKSRLGRLYLDNNEIESLGADLFASQANMYSLDLDLNQIRSLHVNSFRGLENLSQLSIEKNFIQELPAGVFNSLVNLQSLNLNCNEIRLISRGVFGSLAKLTSLVLDNNPIESIEDNAFTGLDGLFELSLSNCKLTSIRSSMFNGLKALEHLFVISNQISSFQVASDPDQVSLVSANLTPDEMKIVQQELFRDLQNLTELSLRGNRIEKLDLNCFCNLKRLQSLDLSSNIINEINKQAHQGTLEHLTSLRLEDNQLVFVDKCAFSQSSGLRELNVSRNKLKRLDDDFFAPFESLSNLNLQQNNLSLRITDSTFPGSQLSRLNLLDNRSVSIEDGAFERMLKLVSLKLDLSAHFSGLPKDSRDLESDESNASSSESLFLLYDHLDYIFLQKSSPDTIGHFLACEENRSAYRSVQRFSIVESSLSTLDGLELGKRFVNLKQLDLSKNRLGEMRASWLEDLSALTDLQLADNSIESLDEPGLFQNVPRLQSINLSRNQLKHLNRSLFRRLLDLKSLDLSDNMLSRVDHGLFRGLMHLKDLNLSRNLISDFNAPKLFELCRELSTLGLQENPLSAESIKAARICQEFRSKRLLIDTEFL